MLNGNEIIGRISDVKRFISDQLTSGNWDDIFQASTDKISDFAVIVSALLRSLEIAQVVYWDTGIAHAAESGSALFRGKQLSALAQPLQLWVYSNHGPNVIGCLANDGSKAECLAELFWLNAYKTRCCYTFLVPFDRPQVVLRIQTYGLVEGEPIPQTDSKWEQVESCIQFMHQPFIDNTTVDRIATFTGAHHQQKKNDAKKISIIYLRRREHYPTLANGTHNPVDWSCQWIVIGHWRNQYHPSDKSHEPMFIQSYVKGPPDKPFKASQTIYAAVR